MRKNQKKEFDSFVSEDQLGQFISSFFPLKGVDGEGEYVLDYVGTKVEMPAYSAEACIQKGLSYEAGVDVIVSRKSCESHEETSRVLKLTPVPLMTEDGLFVVKGRKEDIFNDYRRKNGITFTIPSFEFSCTTISLHDGGVLKLKCKKEGYFVEFGKVEVPFALVLRCLGYSTRDILQKITGCKVVKCTEENLKRCIGHRLAEPISMRWYEDYVDEDSGEVVSNERNELLIASGVILDEAYIELILNLNIEDICIVENDLTEIQERFLRTLPIGYSTELITAWLYKDIFGEYPEDAHVAFEKLKEIILPSISVFTRSQMNLVMRQDNRTDTGDKSGESYGCLNFTKEDYLKWRQGVELGSQVLGKNSKRTDQVDIERLFFIYIKKELTRLTQVWKRKGTLEKLSAAELAGHEKAFSIIDALAYLQLPSSYVSTVDAPIYEDNGNGYNFTGEKLVRYGGESTQLELVKIKAGTRSICTGAFERMCAIGCPFPSGLKIGKVLFPEGLEEIGVNAFADVDFESDFQLPDSLLSIRESAFYRSSVRSFAIPKNLRYFGRHNIPFYPLSGISVHPGNRHFCTKDNALYDKKLKRLILVSIPRVSFYSFEDMEIETLDLPEGLISIDPDISCSAKHLLIPSTLRSGSSWCRGNWFGKISVAENNECYSLRDGCLCSKKGDVLYAYEASKTVLRIPDSVKYIRPLLFSKIKKIYIPKGMKHLTDHMFSGCYSLTDVYLPEGEIYVDRYAFEDNFYKGDWTFHVSEKHKHLCKFRGQHSDTNIVYY